MKKINVFLIMTSFLFITTATISCKKDEPVTPIVPEETTSGGGSTSSTGLTQLPAGSQTFSGNLTSGQTLSSLSWAWTSSMACFVEPVKSQYQGSHVFYKLDLPTNSTLDIYLRPTNASDEIALYGYSKGAGSTTLPPAISSCVSCESSPSANLQPTTSEQHIYLNATTNPYSIIIGVAGANGLTSGAYEIEVVVES